MQATDLLTQTLKNVSTYLILFFFSESQVRVDAPEKNTERRHVERLISGGKFDEPVTYFSEHQLRRYRCHWVCYRGMCYCMQSYLA